MPKQFRRGHRDTNPTLALRFMKHADVTLSADKAIASRYLVRNATSDSVAVQVRLHGVRDGLEAKLGPTLKTFDEIQRKHAKKNEAGEPIVTEGKVFIPTMTQAYELDSANAEPLSADLAALYAERVTVNAPVFTEEQLEKIKAEGDIGAAMIHFLEQ